jgi:hypothetical protein
MTTRPLTSDVPEPPEGPLNRARGAQKGNGNAKKHGLYAANAGRIDLRRSEDRAVFATQQAIELDLGGSDAISSQRKVILDGIGRKLRDLFKIEAYLAGLKSIVNKRRRCLFPIVLEKHRLLESVRRDLESIGLERREKQIASLEEYLAHRSGD